MVDTLRKLALSTRFQHFITGVILFAGIIVGIETSPELVARYGGLLHAIDLIILAIFIAEIGIKLGAAWPNPWNYFRDPWNVFDFLIVAAALLPINSEHVTVLRLLRLLRVLRLLKSVPRLQILVGALLKSLPSMGYVALLLSLLFYVYGVAGTFLFSVNDPVNFGSLGQTMISLFSTVTLEGWVDLMNIQVYGCDKWFYPGSTVEALCTKPQAHTFAGPAYFISFVLLGTMIFLNLMVGVIINGMEEAANERAHEERSQRAEGLPSLSEEMEDLAGHVKVVQEQLALLHTRVRMAQHLDLPAAPAATPTRKPAPAKPARKAKK